MRPGVRAAPAEADARCLRGNPDEGTENISSPGRLAPLPDRYAPPMLGLLVLTLGLMPFVLGLVAWRLLGRDQDSRSDDPPPPPPPSAPRPVAPTRPRRCRDRAPVSGPRARVPRPLVRR
jgi:hypothetical protein